MHYRSERIRTGISSLGRHILLFPLLVGLAVAGTWAQGGASIEGTVTDATGSTIPGATLEVKNLETGAVRDVVTDDAGRYVAPLLAIGRYQVTAAKAGFEKESRTGIALAVGQQLVVNFRLRVGKLDQSVVVTDTATSAGVTTEDSSGLVGEREVKDLPLNGRSYDQLLTLNPGVVNYTSQRAGGIGTSNSVVGNMFSASGRRPQENVFLLNGVEFTGASEIDDTPGGVSGQLLGVDAVREFNVVTDTYGAQYGKRPGAQVNIVTSSGSNQLHGDLYEFVRNSALDARNFFDHGSIPEFQRNEFGGSLGGPIQKNKTFLFSNYEGFRQTLGVSDLTLEPDAASWSTAVASIKALQPLWPAITSANSTELLTPTGASTGIAEVFSNPVQQIREDFGTVRLDHIFSQKDSLAGIYTVDDGTALSPSSNPESRVNISLREQVASVSETHAFSADLLNEGTFGFSRGGFYFNSAVTPGSLENGAGWIQASQPIGAIVVGGGTTLNGASQITNGGTNAGSNLSVARNLFTGTDQITLIHGKHLLSFGAWIQGVQSNDVLVQDQYGQVSFTSLSTFLSGTVSTYTYAPSNTPLEWRSLEGAFFAEDAIKLKPSLELRIGFRGESTNGWNEAQGRASNYVFNSSGVIETQPAIGNSALAENNAKFLPAPRVGIAWAPFPSNKTVIRAGFGLYYGLLDDLSYRLDQNSPYNTVYAVKGVTASGPGHTLPYSNISPTANYAALNFNDSIVPSGVQPNLQTPTVEAWSLKIEQELPGGITLGIGYAGSRGYHELLSTDANLPPVQTVCPAAPCPSGYPAGALYYPTQTITATSTGLANPGLWNSTNWFSEGVSSYNGLTVDVAHRMGHGLQFRGVYTFAKALDDGDSMNTSVATNSPAFLANPLNPGADYGRASFDIRHSAVINATYDLPFGPGKPIQGSSWVNRLIENWQLGGIETLQSGLPFTPQLSYNPSNDGDTRNPVRPSLNPAFTGSVIGGGPNQYFNPLAFIQPAAGTYGNVGRNTLQGPGLAETDFSVARRLLFTERLNLQFRAEFFNLFNRANFNTPNPVVYTAATGAPSPTAGVITSTSTTSRQVQFGLKLLW